MAIEMNMIWIILCGFLIFFMQAGFTCLEVGFVHTKNVIFVAIENLLTFMITTICFCIVGFPVMFGESFYGFFGTSLWGLRDVVSLNDLGYSLVFIELMFATVAVTIFAGAMSERTKIVPLLIMAVISSTIIYPVFGHWVWGGSLLNQETWLSSLGFMDFAGASVVHITAGFTALAGITVVGSRKNTKNSKTNIPFASIGVLILWFGWMGFNGSGNFEFTDLTPLAILNTNIAAATGMLGALSINFITKSNNGYLVSLFNGVLGGLVAITACAYYCTPLAAMLLGFVTGIIVDLSTYVLRKLNLDDAINAIPVHLFGGICGCVLLPFFIREEFLLTSDRMTQFGVQLIGVIVNFMWVYGLSFVVFKLINKIYPMRVTFEEEEKGLNIVEFDDYYSWETYTERLGFEEKINEKNILLRKQARLLVVTEEQEKAKLARDLHDGVGQTLASLKLVLQLFKKNTAVNDCKNQSLAVENACELVDTSIDEMRNVLQNLKPQELEKNGLEGGINRIINVLNEYHSGECTLEINDEIPKFDDVTNLNIYRVLQEVSTNILKHSDSNLVKMVLKKSTDNKMYIFCIEDDGKGFDMQREKQGIGLSSMADRMKMLGGKFNIKSSINKGTVITMEVPLNE